tara:strand:+ start:989 stop:2422 length:1434 start_codon:yes stop_codon:yes gene_type:complete
MRILQLIIFLNILFSVSNANIITSEKKKLIILSSKDHGDISLKINQIVSSSASQLKRYYVIDRSQTEVILNEQKFQHSGGVDQNQAIELGKISGADEAILVNIINFGQQGVPTQEEKKEDKDEPETGLVGWVIKEAVKAKIDKDLQNVERYPNNIKSIINGDVHLINVETSQLIMSFSFSGEHTGGIKTESLSKALDQIRYQISNELKSFYVLKSEVIDINRKYLTLLLGSDIGVEEGTLFEIYSPNIKRKINNRDIVIPGKSVGIVKVKSSSINANQSIILRKWDKIELGFQAQELVNQLLVGGIDIKYGINPFNLRIRAFAEIDAFNKFSTSLFSGFGLVEDSHQINNSQISFGCTLNNNFIRNYIFNVGSYLTLPVDVNFRSDHEQRNDESNIVFLPIISPRMGLRTSIMIAPEIDMIVKSEYVLASIKIGDWRYNIENEEQDIGTYAAYWMGKAPEINYNGWMLSLGFRSIFF